MDDIYRRRRQNENRMRLPSDTRYQQEAHDGSDQRQYHQSGPSSGERQQMMPTSSRILGSSGAPAPYGGYYQESPGTTYTARTLREIPYPQPSADYTQDARHSQGFSSAYHSSNTQMMYGVPQPVGQGTDLDSSQSFASRHHAGLQMMAPDVASSAYYVGDASAAGSLALHQQSTQSGPSSAVYHQQAPPSSRASVNVGYGGGMDPLFTTSSHGPQQTLGATSGRSTGTAAAGPQDYAETHEAFTTYQITLKDVFKDITSGDLPTASESLLSISDWLLTRVELLGLTSDDEDLYESRLKLWRNFNNAWLGLLEKQKETMWPENALQETQNIITFENLRKMGRELVRLCDGIERFGLVDYDYGVWEERIMAVLTECVELYKITQEETASAASESG